MSRITHHVVHNLDGGWDVKRGGANRSSGHFETKNAAEKFARQVSVNQNSELIIHGIDGKIQRADSHGKDPHPPKDKK